MTIWDEGVDWFTRQTEPPTALPLTVSHVQAQVLRVATDATEDAFIAGAIAAATEQFERDTGRSLVPQTWQQVMSRFPYGSRQIVIARVPLISIDSISYVDADGVTQSMAVSSPADIETIPGGEFRRARLTPLYDETWPDTRCQPDAVTITFTCGYEDSAYPQSALTGIGLLVGELYKTRTLTTDGQVPAHIQTSRFWRKVEG